MTEQNQVTPSFAAVCPQCNEAAPLNIAAEWDTYFEETGDPPSRWTTAKCGACGLPSLWAQDYFHDGWSARAQMFPEPIRRLSSAVPDCVREDFDEARVCMSASAHTAAVIMARRAIESICVDRGETKGPLVQRLKKMRDAGVVDDRLFE